MLAELFFGAALVGYGDRKFLDTIARNKFPSCNLANLVSI